MPGLDPMAAVPVVVVMIRRGSSIDGALGGPCSGNTGGEPGRRRSPELPPRRRPGSGVGVRSLPRASAGPDRGRVVEFSAGAAGGRGGSFTSSLATSP